MDGSGALNGQASILRGYLSMVVPWDLLGFVGFGVDFLGSLVLFLGRSPLLLGGFGDLCLVLPTSLIPFSWGSPLFWTKKYSRNDLVWPFDDLECLPL